MSLCAHVCVHLECRRLLSALGCKLKKTIISISMRKKETKKNSALEASDDCLLFLTRVVLQSKMQNTHCSVNTSEVGPQGVKGGGKTLVKK